MIKYKKTIAVISICLLSKAGISQVANSVQDKVTKNAFPFALNEVRLLNSPFKIAMQKDATWLLSLEPDRFLHRFRENARLKPKGELYGGWESRGVSGHSLGHYLSACAMMYAASGDERFKQKVDYIVAELLECQQARKTGYVGGIPDEDKIFDEVSRGDIRSQGFDLNGGWVPWYTEHKVLAGLLDAWQYTHNEQAKQVAIKFCDWIYIKFKNLDEVQFQKMLECEHGGINESLATVYAITGDKKYLDLSYRFDHKRILDPLAEGKNILSGIHANTQIPKIIGSARQYELTGNPANLNAANFFWNMVVNHYTYVIGGNSDHERFSNAPDQLSKNLSSNSTETCNSYNMLKLTNHLYELDPKAFYMDYYERVLYNHILASQNPDNGMVLYYLTLASGTEKKFGTPEDSFWCCTGTGMENHVKYGQDIFYKDHQGGLYINLFIPSVLTWKRKGITLQMDTRYPDEQTINITFKETGAKGVAMPIHFRYPKWAINGATLRLNGKSLAVKGTPGNYFTIRHLWQKGDKLTLTYPMSLYTESMPDNVNKKAFLYGPLVLAGRLGTTNIKQRDIPVFVNADTRLSDWIKPAGEGNVFYASTDARPVTLAPLYKVYNEKQAVYWDFFTPEQWKIKQQQFEADRKAEEELNLKTLDMMRTGEMQPERDHEFEGENTNTGDVDGNRWRDATGGGWFSFKMDTKSAKRAALQCSYFGGDGDGREFDILVNGQKIATEMLKRRDDARVYTITYPLPEQVLQGKQTITIKFQALPGKTAGGLFGCRLLKSN